MSCENCEKALDAADPHDPLAFVRVDRGNVCCIGCDEHLKILFERNREDVAALKAALSKAEAERDKYLAVMAQEGERFVALADKFTSLESSEAATLKRLEVAQRVVEAAKMQVKVLLADPNKIEAGFYEAATQELIDAVGALSKPAAPTPDATDGKREL